jgi:hypothetical protein
MTPGTFAPSQRDTRQPKYEENHSHDPKEMYGDPDPGEQ